MGTTFYLVGKMESESFERLSHEKLISKVLNENTDIALFDGVGGVMMIHRKQLIKCEKYVETHQKGNNSDDVLRAMDILKHIRSTMDSLNNEELFFYFS